MRLRSKLIRLASTIAGQDRKDVLSLVASGSADLHNVGIALMKKLKRRDSYIDVEPRDEDGGFINIQGGKVFWNEREAEKEARDLARLVEGAGLALKVDGHWAREGDYEGREGWNAQLHARLAGQG